jgi:hypothetical protein
MRGGCDAGHPPRSFVKTLLEMRENVLVRVRRNNFHAAVATVPNLTVEPILLSKPKGIITESHSLDSAPNDDF